MSHKLLINIYNNKRDDFVSLSSKLSLENNNTVKDDIKNNLSFWKTFNHELQNDIVQSDYDFPRLYDWATCLEEFLSLNNYFPSIENFSALQTMQDFNSLHITKTTNINSSNSYPLDLPTTNLDLQFKNKKITFYTKEINLLLTPKPVDQKEFKIVRIQSHNEAGTNQFTDVKVRKFDRKKFLFDILTLPEFWRNFHFVSRKKKMNGAIVHPAYNINKCLNSFYTPHKNFSISSNIGKNKKEIFENIKSNSPLKISVESFAMHLFFSQPGLILPLTEREKIWSLTKKPEMIINLNENEVNLITINYSKSSTINKKLLEEFSESFSEREQSFAKHYDLGQYSGGQYLLTTNEEFAFVYETNMIELFDSLSKFDKHTNV